MGKRHLGRFPVGNVVVDTQHTDDRVVGVSQRNLRVQKYRGSGFEENESPFVISKDGFDVAISRALGAADAKVSVERVSTGVERLDSYWTTHDPAYVSADKHSTYVEVQFKTTDDPTRITALRQIKSSFAAPGFQVKWR